MKTLILGDIHGHDSWKENIEKEKPDKIVFLGDYFDCYDKISPKEQVNNFNEICKLKEQRENDVILCFGNHDWCNYSSYGSPCSGFNIVTKQLLGSTIDALIKNKMLLPIYINDNIIFSHAGVSNIWLEEVYEANIADLEGGFDLEKIKTLDFNWNYGYNGYGDTVSQSPIWIRPNSLLKSKVEGYAQVVGHTPISKVYNEDNIWFCDSLPNSYLIIENDKFIVKTVNKNEEKK